MKEEKLQTPEVEQEEQVPRKRWRLRSVMLGAVVAAMLSVSALADDDTSMTSVISAVDNLTSMLSKVWSLMTSNPYLTTFLALSLLSAGFSVFRKAKRTARH